MELDDRFPSLDNRAQTRRTFRTVRRMLANTSNEMRHAGTSIDSVSQDLQRVELQAAQLESLMRITPNQTVHLNEEIEVSKARAAALYEEVLTQESGARQLESDLRVLRASCEAAEDSCVICKAAPGTFALMPCGHRCLCA